MASIDIKETLPLVRMSEADEAPHGSPLQVRYFDKILRYWYHDSRKEAIHSGPISAYPIKETEAASKFGKEYASGKYVWLSPFPLSSLSDHIYIVDITKLDNKNLRYTGQSEGYMLHRGDIPESAIISYNRLKIDPLVKQGAEESKQNQKSSNPTAITGHSTPAPDTEGPKEFRIHENNMPWLEKRFGKMSKIAAEVGSIAPTYTQVRDEFIPKYQMDNIDSANPHPVLDGNGQRIIIGYDHYLYITVQGEAPKIAGWTFVASITHTDAGNIINHVPGQTLDLPEKYRTGFPWCDYCETTRRRTDSFVVHSDKGEYKQIGRNCLAKFLGFSNPERVADYASWMSNLATSFQAEIDEEEIKERNRGGSWNDYEDLETFLTMVAAVNRLYGWVSKAQAETTNKPPSIAEVNYQLSPFHHERDWEKHKITPIEEDEKQAKAAIAYARSDAFKPDTDYKSNLKISTSTDHFHRKAAGVVASLINFHERDKAWEIQKEQRRIETEKRKLEEKFSDFLGEIGDKVQGLTIRVIMQRNLDSDFGVSYLYKMVDTKGNMLTWFSSHPVMEQGHWYSLKGTIKKLETYQDVKQTVLTRCKVMEIDPPAGYTPRPGEVKESEAKKGADEFKAMVQQNTDKIVWKLTRPIIGERAWEGYISAKLVAEVHELRGYLDRVYWSVIDKQRNYYAKGDSPTAEMAKETAALVWVKQPKELAMTVPQDVSAVIEQKDLLEPLEERSKRISKESFAKKQDIDDNTAISQIR